MPPQVKREATSGQHHNNRGATGHNAEQGEDDRMGEDSPGMGGQGQRGEPATTVAVTPSDVDLIWQSLGDYPITRTMSKLLNLVSLFRQAMESRLQMPHKVILTLFLEPNHRPTVINHQNRAIKFLVLGTKITGCVVYGGSGVNVISKATCNKLGINP